jgi:hypothetical protein
MFTFFFEGTAVTIPRLLQNRFLIGDQLDRGGFGTVYSAYDKVQEATVAVKIVSF